MGATNATTVAITRITTAAATSSATTTTVTDILGLSGVNAGASGENRKSRTVDTTMVLVIAAVATLIVFILYYVRKSTPSKSTRASTFIAEATHEEDVEYGIEDRQSPFVAVQKMTLNNAFVPTSQTPTGALHQQEPARRIVAYGADDDAVSPLDDCLQGRWVHNEQVSRKHDITKLLEVDDPQIGDFGVLQNVPGHEVWGILVVVFSVDGQVKAKRTEIERLPGQERFFLRACRLTRGESLYIHATSFGEVLAKISENGDAANLVEVPLVRGLDVLTGKKLTLAEARDAEEANAKAMYRTNDITTHSLRVAARSCARLVFQKCWIDHDVSERILGMRGTGSFVIWQKSGHRSHLVLSMRKGGAHEFTFKHFDIRQRHEEVVLHLGPAVRGGFDEQLKCKSIEELIVALSSADLPSQVPCRLVEGLLSSTRPSNAFSDGSMEDLDWYHLCSEQDEGSRETSL